MTENNELDDFAGQLVKIGNRFRKSLKNGQLDSKVFFNIPVDGLDNAGYREWLIDRIEVPWMRKYNPNPGYDPELIWNSRCVKLCGDFRCGLKKLECDLMRCDGEKDEMSAFGLSRLPGLKFSAQYNPLNVGKVLLIADNFSDFLSLAGIKHERFEFDYQTGNIIR